MKRLLKEASGNWKSAILFAFYTGARLGDVANMPWSAIDWQERTITFIPKKTGRRKKKKLVVPLHPELEKELLKSAGVGVAPLFPELAGRDTGGPHGLSAETSQCRATAIDGGEHSDNSVQPTEA